MPTREDKSKKPQMHELPHGVKIRREQGLQGRAKVISAVKYLEDKFWVPRTSIYVLDAIRFLRAKVIEIRQTEINATKTLEDEKIDEVLTRLDKEPKKEDWCG